MKEITALSAKQCWRMVNRIDTLEKAQIAIQWLDKADITTDEYDELMNSVAFITRELYRK